MLISQSSVHTHDDIIIIMPHTYFCFCLCLHPNYLSPQTQIEMNDVPKYLRGIQQEKNCQDMMPDFPSYYELCIEAGDDASTLNANCELESVHPYGYCDASNNFYCCDS